MRDAPIAARLHLGPNSHAVVTVSFPGTNKAIALTQGQFRRLFAGFEEAKRIIDRDDGELRRTVAIDLLEGIDA